MSLQNVDENSTIQHIVEANECLQVLLDAKEEKSLQFGPMDLRRCVLVGIGDAALRRKSEKYSQGCFYVMLVERSTKGGVGGRCHVLEFRTNKATRVSKGSMGAEILILNRASEALQRLSLWLAEIFHGCDDAKDLLRTISPFPTQLITDAMDIFQVMQCDRSFTGSDESMSIYLECLREDLVSGRVDELIWVPTASMLCDSGTKVMQDVLANTLMRTGTWIPEEFKVLKRESLSGGTGTKSRLWQEYRTEEEEEVMEEYNDLDEWTAWFSGCQGIFFVGRGCDQQCPSCSGRLANEAEEEEDLDVYWLG